MSKVKLEVTLNNGLHTFDDFREFQQEINFYSFCKSHKNDKIFLLATSRKKKIVNWIYFIVLPIWLLLLLILPAKWFVIVPIWIIFSLIFCFFMFYYNKKMKKSVQFFPLMILDPQKKSVTFLRKKPLAYLQIQEPKKNFSFSEIVKSQILFTYVIKNSPQEDVSLLTATSVLILYTKTSIGDETPNMIFAAIGGQYVCNHVAKLLNQFAGIPIERQYGSMHDVRKNM